MLYHRRYPLTGALTDNAGENSSAAPPLLVLHGLLGSGENWHGLCAGPFAQRSDVICVDQRNHGRSPHLGPGGYRAMAEDLIPVLDELGIERCDVLGHSMGGKTAMVFALLFPERVDRLVVADIAAKAYPPMHRAIFDALLGLNLPAAESRKQLDNALAEHVSSVTARAFLLKNAVRSGTGGFRWRNDLASIEQSYEAILRSVEASIGDRVPSEPTDVLEVPPAMRFSGQTLCIRGGKSEYLSESDMPRIRRLFPAAQLATISDAGHWVHSESPRAFAEAVTNFLER